MQTLAKALQEVSEFRQLLAGIEGGACPLVLSGLSEIHCAHVVAAIRSEVMQPIVVICADDDEMNRLAGDVASLSFENTHTLAAREFTFYNAEVVSRQNEQQRIATLTAMMEGNAPIVVMTIGGVLQRTMHPMKLAKSLHILKINSSYDMNVVIETLILCGYSRSDQVEGTGQFAVRGGIIDFFSPMYEEPIRCEFFGNEIDSMGFFDIESQRRTDQISMVQIVPVAETLISHYEKDGMVGAQGLAAEIEEQINRLDKRKATSQTLLENLSLDMERILHSSNFSAADRYIELIYPMATALDYIASDTIVIMCEPLRIKERADNYLKLLGEDSVTLLEAGILESSFIRFSEDWGGFLNIISKFATIMTDSFSASSYPLGPRMMLNMSTKRLPSYGGSLDTAASDIAHYRESGFRTIIMCRDQRSGRLLKEHLDERGIPSGLDYSLQELPKAGECIISEGYLSAGMEYPGIKLAVITEGQISLGPIFSRRRRSKAKANRERIQSFSDLSPGDLVVHDHHGIGRFVGLFKIPVDGVRKDYVKIAYAGTDSLYVPATQLDTIAKYIGGGTDGNTEGSTRRSVKLSKLGGTDWSRVKSRAKSAAKEMAAELIKLYAERQRIKGNAFPEDSIWQTEFEEKFGYQETDDQLKCADEIKADMEKPIPMDRLLCGDVGYGKTEIALRAVMKCVLGGFQAAILVPTTVLAQQHFVTSMRRFAGYPVNIEVLSRFRSKAEVKAALKGLENGSVDLVIGTHRLLQKDVHFAKLGLLVVDEEQRFGVSHKERLKELSKQVDVLTLSATPIPRTLNMALSGVRDMSTIEEPPQSRHPVQTYVLEHEWSILCDAIRREVSRGGQVYYLHNRIENIERVTASLSEMLEGVSLAVAHGRMDEDSLSEVMERMTAGEIQVLVCTTIIESGIDIPNVNTLIVEDADRLGLAQLHQIRGRVGRSPRRAYAYLTFRRGKVLSEVAQKRLSAIREFAEFNSGFKIAMRDLEIRGAGSLLGAEQSGHMLSVGYDMYLKLLEEAVLEEKGEKQQTKAECPADLNVEASIPEKYVPSGGQRMDIYRRIALIRTKEDCDDMIDELIDRYGDPPKEVLALTSIALMRSEAAIAGITEITQKDGWLQLKLSDFEMDNISRLYGLEEYTGRIKVIAGTDPAIALKLVDSAIIDEAVNLVRAYQSCQMA
ncbi:MAG: transcription-repair coupling factor [Oscillospiraceae bacterium]|nr:transcription-repair coupling factor [Oscillospiraceae bacterium]